MILGNHQIFMEGLQKALLKVQEPSPGFVLLGGPCEYFIYKGLNAIKTVWRSKTSSSCSFWEAEDLKKNVFYELCEQRNLFEKASLHLIRKIKKQADLANWLSGLAAAPQNLIVLSVESDKLNPKLLEALKNLGAISIPCQEPAKSETEAIAKQLLTKRKLSLQTDALNALLQSVGGDLYTLGNEIERLSLIFTDQTPVSLPQLQPLLNALSEEQSFALVQLLLERKTEKAQLFISELLQQGESPIGLVGILAWHCRNTLKLFESARSKSPAKLRMSYSLQKGYQTYVRTINPKNVIQALLACQESDSALKSTPRNPEHLLFRTLTLLT